MPARSCGCHLPGSWNNSAACDPHTGVCHCKPNVEGQNCDRCKPGFFDLQFDNELGCVSCFCYGHSSICTSSPRYTKYNIESIFTRDAEKWNARDRGNREILFQYNPLDRNIGITIPNREPVYFVAPERYLGDQRASYNQLLAYTLRIGEDGPRATVEDLVLEGSGLTISQPIFGQGNPLPSSRRQEYKFRLHESVQYGWTPRLTSKDFISILANLTAIKIRVTYTPGGTGYLDDVRLESAQQLPFGQKATWIETCTCPKGN